jgi:hypothetical protein
MKDRKIALGIVKAILTMKRRAINKHSAVRNHFFAGLGE